MRKIFVSALSVLLVAVYGSHTVSPSRPVAPHKSLHGEKNKKFKRRKKPTRKIPPARRQIHGTIIDGQLQTTVWAGVSPNGPLYPVALMVDTGAVQTMVSGRFWRAMGDRPTVGTATFSGIGGTEQVRYWPHVWVFPKDQPIDAVIAGATEPGGVNRSMLGPEGIIVLLGQDVISRGVLTQNGGRWTFKY